MNTLQEHHQPLGDSEGSPWFREFYDLFAPVRQEAIDKGYTDEEINTWIDEALQASRAERK